VSFELKQIKRELSSKIVGLENKCEFAGCSPCYLFMVTGLLSSICGDLAREATHVTKHLIYVYLFLII
jgi:hypothetical protein